MGVKTRASTLPDPPSRTYVYGLVGRSPELKVQKARIIESDRAKYVTPTTLGNFFDKLEGLFKEGNYSPHMIANFDESMIQCTAKKLTVVGHSEQPTLFITQQSEMPHITIGVCVFADGSHARHLMVYPFKRLPAELDETFLHAYPATAFCGQPTGWINAEILENYLTKIIIPQFEAQRQKPGASHRGLLLIDGHASRINAKLWKTFQDNDIDVLTFVSHASHVIQPLDLCVFAAFKSRLRAGMSALRTLTLGQRRAAVVKRAFDSLYHALSPVNILSGFEKAGVWPLNRDIPLGHAAVNRDPTIPPVPYRKRKTSIALDGDILTSEDAIRRMLGDSATSSRNAAHRKQIRRKTAKKTTHQIPYDDDTDTVSWEESDVE